jgi:ubiquinone biosynthesis monooxygenase Coq7
MIMRHEKEIPNALKRRSFERLPGDLSGAEARARMIRVDHAGEYGARRIYDGQLAVLGNSVLAEPLRHMAAQEDRHYDTFDRLVREHRVRPTVLTPLWHLAGFALGAATAFLGPNAAMACTEAVEEVIEEHYERQIAALGPKETAFKETLENCMADEIQHRDIARSHGAKDAPAYELLTSAIKAGSRLAIWLSERL